MNLKEIIEKIERLKKEFDSLKPIKKEYKNKIWDKFRLDWNYHSNHIEGNSLTYEETKVLIEKGNIINTTSKPKKDYDEIEGHNKAIDIIIDMAERKSFLTEAVIRELHKIILPISYSLPAETPDGKPTKRTVLIGQYKIQPNHVRRLDGKDFFFATPEETKPQMMELVDSFRNKEVKNIKDILFIGTEFHYKFVLIHPFDDGNGRIARLILNYFLLLHNLPPIIIKTEDKKNYFTALEASDAGNLESLIIYIGLRAIESLELYIKGANGESIDELQDIDKQILLLEKKVEALGANENRKEKNEQTVLSVLENSVLPLLKDIYSKLSKLNSFFKEVVIITVVNYTVSKHNKENSLDFLWNQIRTSNPQDLQSIGLHYNLNSFKKVGVNDFNESIYLHFTFEKYKYSLKYNNNDFTKLYDQFLNKEEINNIASDAVKDCLGRIEKIINNSKFGP